MTRISLSTSIQIEFYQVLKILPVLILLTYLILGMVSFITAEERELINIFDDDAYLYFKIARNFSQTGQMTFDGKNTTNRFHPLWMIVLILFYSAAKNPLTFLRSIGIFSTVLVGISGFLSLRYLFRYSILPYYLASALLIISIISFGITGMEVTLLLPLIMVVLIWSSKAEPWSSRQITSSELVGLGLLLAMIQLTRLDAIFLVITLLVFVVVRLEPGELLKRIFIICIIPFITGTAYLLLNYAIFHHLIPTSGVAKSLASSTLWINRRFLAQLTTPNNAVDGNLWFLFLALLLLASGYLLYIAYKKLTNRRPVSREDYLPIMVSTFMIIFSAYQVLRTSWVLWRWYAYPIIPICVFLVPEILNRIEKRLQQQKISRFPIRVLCVVLLPILVVQLWFLGIKFGYWSKPHGESFQYENYQIAEALNREFPDPMVFAVGDRAGAFAYFYRGKVLQLEGLVGDYQLIRALQANKIMEYMNDFGVQYVMSYVPPNPEYSQWTLSTPLPWLSSGPYADIILCRQTEVQQIETQYSVYTIWKWPSCDLGKTNSDP